MFPFSSLSQTAESDILMNKDFKHFVKKRPLPTELVSFRSIMKVELVKGDGVMITFENMAAFVCHYGGTPKPELERLYDENKQMFERTGKAAYRERAHRFMTIIHMIDGGVHFVEHEQASTFYYEPEEGWQILFDILPHLRLALRGGGFLGKLHDHTEEWIRAKDGYRYLDSVPSMLTDVMRRVERHRLGIQHSQVPYVGYLALHSGFKPQSCLLYPRWVF